MTDTAELLTFYRERVQSYPDAPDGYPARWVALCRRILTHGGRLVVPPLVPERHLDQLADATTTTLPAKRRHGRPSDCHANSAALWIGGDAHTIGTGYALSEDGLWRQHTWGITGTGARRRILETTVARQGYYGFELTGADALLFAAANAQDVLEQALRAGPSQTPAHLWEAVTAIQAR